MKRSLMYRFQVIISLSIVMVFFQNCSNTDYSVQAIDNKLISPDIVVQEPDVVLDVVEVDIVEPEVQPPIVVDDVREENVVCDPFTNGENVAQGKSGIKADLFYLENTKLPRSSFQNIVDNGVKSEKVIFLNDINVPTRNFTQGFTTQSNELLKKANGDNLIEWFALSMKGQLQLGPEEEAGDYQFATLSDDGAILYMQQPGTKELGQLTKADGHHSTQLACALSPVRLEEGKKVEFKLNYFQGPRTQIAMILLYRPYNAETVLDPLCGKESMYEYFDSSTSPSTEKPLYKALLSRGWKPVPASNYVLPEEVKVNPCAAM